MSINPLTHATFARRDAVPELNSEHSYRR